MSELSELIRYRLASPAPIAQHGQGAIWHAHDLLFGTDVAIKQIAVGVADEIAAQESFRKEASAGARLGQLSPYIVRVTDYGRVGSLLYFAMEWVDGSNLAASCGQLSLRSAVSVMKQIARAVQTAHEHGIVHSDIAPANILVDQKRGTYRLADFGYLKIIDSILISRGIASLQVGGRIYFLPPEHLLDVSRIGFSTDVYALALTLQQLLEGAQLSRNRNGSLVVPNVIRIRHEGRDAPHHVRLLLDRFVTHHTDSDTVEELLEFVSRIPA